MNDHVAVLRMVGKEFRQKCRNLGADCEICARTEAAIAHAIAAVAERDALAAEVKLLDQQLADAMATVARQDALVARLGELEAEWRNPNWLPADKFAAGFALTCADDLARVVKEGGG